MTPEEEQKLLRYKGYDPEKFMVDEARQEIVDRPVKPAVATETTHIPSGSSSWQGAAARSAAVATPPALAGLAAAGLTMTALGGGASATGVGAPIGIPTMLAGLGAGALASFLASKAEEKVLPESLKQQLALDAAEHPYVSMAGQLAPNLIGNQLQSAGNLVKIGRGLIPGTIDSTAKLATRQALANAGINVGLGAGMRSLEGGDVLDPRGIGADVLGSLAFGAPRNNIITRKLNLAGAENPNQLRDLVEEAQANNKPFVEPSPEPVVLKQWNPEIHGGEKELNLARAALDKKLKGQVLPPAEYENLLVQTAESDPKIAKVTQNSAVDDIKTRIENRRAEVEQIKAREAELFRPGPSEETPLQYAAKVAAGVPEPSGYKPLSALEIEQAYAQKRAEQSALTRAKIEEEARAFEASQQVSPEQAAINRSLGIGQTGSYKPITASEASVQETPQQRLARLREEVRVENENLETELKAERDKLRMEAYQRQRARQQESELTRAERENRQTIQEQQAIADAIANRPANERLLAAQAADVRQHIPAPSKGKIREVPEFLGRTSESSSEAPLAHNEPLTQGIYDVVARHFGPLQGTEVRRGEAPRPDVKGFVDSTGATITPSATKDTPFHEVGHAFLDKGMADPRIKAHVDDLYRELEKTGQFKDWSEGAKKAGIDPSVREYVAQLFGEKLAGDFSGPKLKTTSGVKYQLNILLKELKRFIGRATPDDVQELLQNAFVHGEGARLRNVKTFSPGESSIYSPDASSVRLKNQSIIAEVEQHGAEAVVSQDNAPINIRGYRARREKAANTKARDFYGRGAIYYSTDEDIARTYSEARGGGVVGSEDLVLKKPFILDYQGKSVNYVLVDGKWVLAPTYDYLQHWQDGMIRQAKEAGYDSVIFKNVIDTANVRNRSIADTIAVLSPQAVVSYRDRVALESMIEKQQDLPAKLLPGYIPPSNYELVGDMFVATKPRVDYSSSKAPAITRSSEGSLRKEGPAGEYLADRFVATRQDQQLLNGKWRNKIAQVLDDLSAKEQQQVDALIEQTNPYVPPKLRKAYEALREIKKETHDEQRRRGLLVKAVDSEGNPIYREAKDDPNYNPQVIGKHVYETLLKHPESVEAKKLHEDFLDYYEKIFVDSPDPRAAAQTRFDQMFPRKGGKESAEYNAVRLAEGSGIPESWREKSDIQWKWRKYLSRFAADLAFHENIQKDPVARRLLGLKDDGQGNVDAPQASELPTGEDITGVNYSANPHVISMMHDVAGGRSLLPSQVLSASRIANAATVGPLGRVRDIALVPSIAAELNGPLSVIKALPQAIGRVGEGIREALKRGIIDQSQITWHDRTLDTMESGLDRVADLINKYTGSQFLERVARGFSWILGKVIAESNLDNPGFVKKFGGVRDASVIADRIAEQIQGTYDFRGTPTWIRESAFGPLFSLNRWSIERFNNWKKNVYDEAKQGNLVPLLGNALGIFVGSAVIDTINEEVRRAKPEHLSWEEYLKLGGKDTPYKMAAAVSGAGTTGVLGDVILSSLNLSQGRQPRGSSMPFLEIGSNIAERVGQFIGAESFDIPALLNQIAKDNIQVYRDLSPKDENRNAKRDVRVFKRLSGEKTPTILSNPFENQESKEIMKSSNPEEILPKILNEIVAEEKPENVAKKIETLKRSLARGDNSFLEDSQFFAHLEKIYGFEEAVKRLENYLGQKAKRKALSSAIPSLQ